MKSRWKAKSSWQLTLAAFWGMSKLRYGKRKFYSQGNELNLTSLKMMRPLRMKSSLQSCLKFQWRTTRCTFRPRASLSDSRRPPRLQLRPSPLILWMNGQGSPRQRLKPHWEKCCCGFLANRGWRKSCLSWTEEKRSQSRRSAACCFGSLKWPYFTDHTNLQIWEK